MYKILLSIIVPLLNTFYNPRNTKDRSKFIAIKLVNSLAMIFVLGLSTSNLVFIRELVEGEHQQLYNSISDVLYYTYIILLGLMSCIVAIIAFMLLLRKVRARGVFLKTFPILLVLSEIKNYFTGLKHFEDYNDSLIILFVVLSTISWLVIYVFMLLKKTKEYFESA